MRLSELLGSDVVGEDGVRLGFVVDVLAVQDGPVPPGGVDASIRVEGLVVGRDGLGVRLGFHRSGVKGPWPLRALFEALDRRGRLVPWDKVRARSEGRLEVVGTAQDYSSPPSLPARAP